MPATARRFSNNLTALAFGAILLTGAGLVIAACAQTGPAATSVQPTLQPGGTVVVPLANYAFVPSDLTIPVGTTVIFQSADPDPHTVTFDNDEYPELGFEPQGVQQMVFDRIGVYQIFCEYHGSPGHRGMSAIIRVVAADAAAVPTAVTAPTATPRPTLPPLAAGESSPNGFGLFQDSLGRNDTFNLSVTHLPLDPGGNYHAWLTGDGDPLPLGLLSVDEAGNGNLLYFALGGENLLAAYSGFLITIESPGSIPVQPSSAVVFGGVIPNGALGPTRQLLVSGDESPRNIGYAIGLVNMAEELLRHARELDSASQADDVESMNRHIEHLSALLAGRGSPEYLDFEGDSFVDDPGDGYGLLNYAAAIAEQARAVEAATVPTPLQASARQLAEVAGNIRRLGTELLDLRQQAYTAPEAATRKALTLQIHALAQQLLNGSDADGDGLIEATAQEGGVYAAYFQSQYLSAMGAVTQEELSGVPEPETATPEPTATIVPTATLGPTPTPSVVTVILRNFEFVPAALTIKAGTTVVFVIQDSRHGAYLSYPDRTDVGGFDSGTLDPGAQYSIRFDAPALYTIRCTRHQTRMVMTLLVEP